MTRDLVRSCLRCGLDTHPETMTVWRDADGEGHWVHPDCRRALPLLERVAAALDIPFRILTGRPPREWDWR